MARVPSVTGVLGADEVLATARSIAGAQLDSGAIPWFEGGHLDVWDHGQAVMGLAAAGLVDEACAGVEWLARKQRPDGSWATEYWPGQNDRIGDDATDANFTAYPATVIAYLHKSFPSRDFSSYWPVVAGALDAVCSMADPGGAVAWKRHSDGSLADERLVTGNSSIAFSLSAGLWLAEAWQVAAPSAWQQVREGIVETLRHSEHRLTAKERYSMDWYYPVLCGAVVGAEAADRIDARWDEFVVDGLGVRCVVPNPWVTGAESCELVLALTTMGRHDEAAKVFADMQHLRESDGSYWTGLVFDDGKRWPVERTTWTAATVILAADALSETTPGARFIGSDLMREVH